MKLAIHIDEDKNTPCSDLLLGKTKQLTDRPMAREDICRIIRRRAKNAEFDAELFCHTFGATGITVFLENGGSLENTQVIAAHKSPRTTKLYNCTADAIKFEEIERVRL